MLTGALHPDEAYRLPVPTLLLHGENDHLGDIRYSTRAWSQREPLAEYATIPAPVTSATRTARRCSTPL
jgi:hypothetical protein